MGANKQAPENRPLADLMLTMVLGWQRVALVARIFILAVDAHIDAGVRRRSSRPVCGIEDVAI